MWTKLKALTRSALKALVRSALIVTAVSAIGVGGLLGVWWYFSQKLVDDATPVDFPAIYRMAILAKDVYDLSDQEFRSKYSGTSARLDVRELPENQVRYFVLADDASKAQTVVVRGSSNFRNWIVNAEYTKQSDSELKLFLHEGFSAAADELLRSVRPTLKKGYRTSVTGHSLGGALAAVLMMRLMHEGHDIDQVITFGQPKITNEAGASLFAEAKLLRVVNGDDIVPKLPNPTIATSVHGLYYHFAPEVVLLPDGKYVRRKPVLEPPPELPKESEEAAGRGLLDSYFYPHFMSSYLANLETELRGATRVKASDLTRYLPPAPTPAPGGSMYSPSGPADGGAAITSPRLALLVGINRYQSEGINRLTGCVNDVHAMKELLVSRYGFAPSDVKTLTDAEATKDSIIRQFNDHLIARGGADTVAVFHFSGHGSQMKDALNLSPDGRQKTIVPYDSRIPGHFDISDDDLKDLFTKLASRVKALTVVLDSCHSGTGGRGPGVRSIEPDLRDPPRPEPLPGRPQGRGAIAGSAPGGAIPYTLIAACGASESAYELGSGSDAHGALTKFLKSEADKPQAKDQTYRDLMDVVELRVRSAYPFQNTQLEGKDSRMVFGESTSQVQPYVLVSPRPDGGVVLMAGTAVGMTKGSQFDVYAPGTKEFSSPAAAIAHVELDEVSPFTSTAKPIGGTANAPVATTPIPMSARAVERVHAYEQFALNVFFTGPKNPDVLEKIRLGLAPIKHIRVVDDDKKSVLIVELKDQTVTILAPDDKIVKESFPAGEANTPTVVISRLKQWAKWFNLLGLQNPQPTFIVPFGLQTGTDSKNGAGLPRFRTLQEVPVIIRNPDTQSFFFSIVDLQSNGSVSVIFPPKGDTAMLPPGQPWSKKLRFAVPEHYSSIRDYLLVIASREAIKTHFLEMPAITRDVSRSFNPLEQLLSDAAFGDREVQVIGVDADGWAIALFGCETQR